MGVEEQGAKLRLGCRGCNEFQDGTCDQDVAVELDRVPVSGRASKEKYPPALLRALAADKYDASEYTLRIMSEARKRILASGCVCACSLVVV